MERVRVRVRGLLGRCCIENAAFIFPNAPTELLNRRYPFVLRPKYHSSPFDHLHMQQTVIISITFMRPLFHVHSKKHLGVIKA